MSRYHRENPDQPISHDWLEGVEHVGLDKAADIPEPNVASTQSLKSCWFSEHKCPKCGSTLISNGRNLWCSFIGGGKDKACDYGIAVRVTLPVSNTPHPDWVTCCACQADMAEVMELWSEVDTWPDFLNAGCCCQECFDKLPKR